VVKKALILSFLSLISFKPAYAEVQNADCQGLSKLILDKYTAFEESIAMNRGRLTKDQSVDVNKLLSMACSPEFAQCDFSVCKTQQFAPPVATQNPTTQPTEASLPLSTDEGASPLAWVTESMSCEAFLSQLRTRYQSGKLDDAKRKELKMALELACGPKFKQCNFEACQKEASQGRVEN
jgi:hypothetical protein